MTKSLQSMAREIAEKYLDDPTVSAQDACIEMGRAVIAELEEWAKDVAVGPYGKLPYINGTTTVLRAIRHLQSLDKPDAKLTEGEG